LAKIAFTSYSGSCSTRCWWIFFTDLQSYKHNTQLS